MCVSITFTVAVRLFYTELALDGRTVTARTSLSVNDDAGDTDVLLVVDLDSREDLAAMFEDNINANFQPAQAYRYSERGNQGCSS